MATLLGCLTRGATRQGEPLNIISFPTHESYQTNLARTGHRFFLLQGKDIKTWNQAFRPLPEGHVLLNNARGNKQLPPELNFDLVLSQNKFGQYPMALSLASQLHLPLICLEHCLPHPDWSQKDIDQAREQTPCDIQVFISEYSREQWGFGPDEAEIVHHGIDTDLFRPAGSERKNVLLSVVNDWKNRQYACGFTQWQEATRDLPVQVLGDNPGLSHPASSVRELVHAYQNARIFVNTSLVSPIPMAVLEAMASGCAVISLATCMIPQIIQHGHNGLLGETPQEIRQHCLRLLAQPEQCRRLGEQARLTIETRFGLKPFVDRWNQLFERATRMIYTHSTGQNTWQ